MAVPVQVCAFQRQKDIMSQLLLAQADAIMADFTALMGLFEKAADQNQNACMCLPLLWQPACRPSLPLTWCLLTELACPISALTPLFRGIQHQSIGAIHAIDRHQCQVGTAED